MSQTVANSDCSSIALPDGNNTNIANISESISLPDVHTDTAIRASLVTVGTLLLAFTVLALVALNRASSIPKTACRLCSSLLLFDSAATFTFILTDFITDLITLNLISLIGFGWCNAAFINIAVMCIDRVILFQWPYFYVRRFTNGSYVIIYYVIIFTYVVSYTGQWIKCFINDVSLWDVRQCMNIIIIENMTAAFVTGLVVSIPSFLLIIIIIIKQRQRERSRNESRPTIAVFVCCINYSVTIIACFILTYTVCYVKIVYRRVATKIVFMLNGFVDTCVYVLWFKECRYELLKIVGHVVPVLKTKVERMRTEVFDVNTL